jgi:predicted DNA-binding transcriptional regulator YafY
MDKSFRYKQLDQLLRNEDGYTLNDILVRLGDDISKRTLQREIEKLKQPPYNMQFVNDMYRGREKLIRYKDISKSLYDTHNKKLNKFNELLSALDQLSGIPQYDWMKYLLIELSNNTTLDAQSVISFDNNFYLVGIEYLTRLAKAIVHKQPQKIIYKTFKGHKIEVNVHPYHLRQYNNRWFLFCRVDGKENISNYALDRIVSVNNVAIKFVDSGIDFDEWFDDVIGVTIPNTDVEDILIKVKKDRYGYIKTKPLHSSQIEQKKIMTDNYVFITIKVKINKELIANIISYGADVEVISPLSLRESIKNIAEQMFKQYRDE